MKDFVSAQRKSLTLNLFPCKIGGMELRDEIQAYLDATNSKAYHLAKKTGIDASIICRVLSGKQIEMTTRNYRKLRIVLDETPHN